MSDLLRFNKYVRKSDSCWEWLGPLRTDGYAQFWLNGKRDKAHRAAYKLLVGDIQDGLCVCHSCDNRSCVNPSHLFIGTHQDNMQDRDRKGRLNARSGGENGNAALTNTDAENIRAILKHVKRRGVCSELARIYKVNKSTISRIGLNKTYHFIDALVDQAVLPDDSFMRSIGDGCRP